MTSHNSRSAGRHSSNVVDLALALEHLLAARGDACFVIDARGNILAESPDAAALRQKTPTLARLLANQAAQPPKRSAFHPVPALGIGLSLQVCGGGHPLRPLLISITNLEQQPQRAVTHRQRQLLAHLRAGLRNSEIAARMEIRASTVKTMLERLYRLAGVPNRQALSRWAGEHNLG